MRFIEGDKDRIIGMVTLINRKDVFHLNKHLPVFPFHEYLTFAPICLVLFKSTL